MTTTVAIIGALIALLGVMGILSPVAMKGFAALFRSPAGMYTAVVFRLVIGVLLYRAGPYCRPDTPPVGWIVRLLGVLIVIAALALLVIGPTRFRTMLDWMLARSVTFLRCWAAVALVLGAFLIYAGL